MFKTFPRFLTMPCQRTPSNETQTALGATIGDFIWADLDGDGVQDTGEVGISGVTVKLTSAAS